MVGGWGKRNANLSKKKINTAEAILKWPIPLTNSAELAIFFEIWPFFENRPFLSTLCSLKIRRIGHNYKELARVQVEIGKRN